MKIKKFLGISLGIFLLLAFVFSSKVLAIETTPSPSSSAGQGVILSTIDIQNAKIISQEKNVFHISFDISNEKIAQTGVRYAIKLVQTSTDKKEYIVDEKIYDDSLTLAENTKISKEIIYEAPKNLSGDYNLILISRNEDDFPFANESFAKVTLTASEKGITILPETCSSSVQKENTTEKYSILKMAKLSPAESLIVSCQVINETAISQTFTPSFETHAISAFGKKIEANNTNTDSFTLKASEKKLIAITLPKLSDPRVYSTSLSLTNEKLSSNKILINYIITGASASIKNLTLDKDYYKKGETATATLIWNPSIEALTSSTLSLKLLNDKNQECADVYTDQMPGDNLLLKIPLVVTKPSCLNPVIQGTILDKDGKILDQKEFKFTTTSITNNLNKNIIYLIILLVIVFVVVLSFIIKKQKGDKNKIPVPVFFLFFVVALFASLASPQTAKADTTFSLDYGYLVGTVSIDKGYYIAGETLTATGSLVPNSIAINDSKFIPYEVSLEVTVAGATKVIDHMDTMEYGDQLSGFATFTIPRAGGTKTASFVGSMIDSKDVPSSSVADINYDVVYKPNTTFVPSKTNVTSSSDAFTLTWSSSNDGAPDQDCFMQGGTVSGAGLSGSVSTTISATTTFTLSCASGYGNSYYSDTAIKTATINFPAPTVTIYANNQRNPTTPIIYDGIVDIRWTVINPPSLGCKCTLSPAAKNNLGVSTTSCGTSTSAQTASEVTRLYNVENDTIFTVSCPPGI